MPDPRSHHARSAPQLYALVVGVSLTFAGILGFFYESGFGTGEVERDAVFGLLDVNGWHNLVHLSSGLLGLLVAGSFGAARTYALALGATYLLVTLAGFIAGDGGDLLGLIPINTEDNVLHLLLGAAGLGAWFASSAEPAPTTI